MKLVAYLRVSTEAQAEDGLGLDVQEQSIRSWARTHGHRVALWCRDEGVSGSNGVDTRLGLHEALTALEDGQAAGLVVAKLDRLARQLTIQETTLALAWGLGATVYAVDLGEIPKDDPDGPVKAALRQMVGVFAQLERGMIAARLRAGRKLKAERGGYAGGAPSFGYRAEGRELIPDEAEQETLRRILQLRRDGLSLRAIACALEAEGRRPRRGARWQSATLGRILATS